MSLETLRTDKRIEKHVNNLTQYGHVKRMNGGRDYCEKCMKLVKQVDRKENLKKRSEKREPKTEVYTFIKFHI